MTTVSSRLYEDGKTADGVVANLRAAGFPENTIDVIPASGKGADAIAAARVDKADAAKYAKAMKKGNALVVVRAPVTPFGAARRAMDIVDEAASIPAGVANPNKHIEELPKGELFLSVMTSHPLMLTNANGPYGTHGVGLLSEAFGWPLLAKHKDTSSASSGWFASTKLLPFPLLSGHRPGTSAISGGKRMMYNPSGLS